MSDSALLYYVNRLLYRGAKRIAVPRTLLVQASEKEREEARRLCRLAGVEIEIVEEIRTPDVKRSSGP